MIESRSTTQKAARNLAGFLRGKWAAAMLSVAMIGAVLWPIHQNWMAKPRDNFPLSYYPMFSAKRGEDAVFYYMVGRDPEGNRYLIPHRFAGPGGHNTVRRQIRRIVLSGHARELARSVAGRLGGQVEDPWSRITSVAVVRGEYAVDDFFHGRKEPIREQIKASCAVERRAE